MKFELKFRGGRSEDFQAICRTRFAAKVRALQMFKDMCRSGRIFEFSSFRKKIKRAGPYALELKKKKKKTRIFGPVSEFSIFTDGRS